MLTASRASGPRSERGESLRQLGPGAPDGQEFGRVRGMPRGFDEKTWLKQIGSMTLAELRAQVTYWRMRSDLVKTAQLKKGYERRIRAVEDEIRQRFPGKI